MGIPKIANIKYLCSLFALIAIVVVISSSYAFADDNKTNFAILITEQNLQTGTAIWWSDENKPDANVKSAAALAIKSRIRASGCMATEPISEKKRSKIPQDLRDPQISNEKAAKIGKNLNADYVILGHAFASLAAKSMGGSSLNQVQSTVTVRIVDAKKGSIIASGSKEAKAIDKDMMKAGRKSLEKAALELTDKLLNNMSKRPGTKISCKK